MILPIVAYGDPVLRKVAVKIDEHYQGLDKLLEDMFETLYNSSGVGLAAPQIGKSIRLFIIDTIQILEKLDEKSEEHRFKGEKGIREIFINAYISKKDGNEWVYNEGCLSIPNIREDITRPDEITISYLDKDFKPHKKTFKGFTGRVIQHEYDHIEGILFTDHLKPLKKRMLKSKLDKISCGDVKVDYKMKFPLKK
jgi:peptide deformylase